jgi:hypothetical protein
MIGRYYATDDEKQEIFVINVRILNIDTVLTGNTNLKFAKINPYWCDTVLHESPPNFPKTGPPSTNGESGFWPPSPKPRPIDSIVTIQGEHKVLP